MNIIIEKWNEVLETVKKEHELSDISFNTWLKPLIVEKVENEVVTIFVPSKQVGIDYISNKYILPIKVAIAEITGIDCEIEFVLTQTKSDKISIDRAIAASSGLNPKYTFDSFVVGGNNKFAHAASLATAESPGEVYNPLYIYGGVGLGKTHLMHSIAHFIIEHNPGTRVLYVTSETFTNELIDAIRNTNNTAMSKFREKYRNIDVLLIDDVQFIVGKESTQEEFFHTFNHLHSAKKQIIISSDKPPKDISILEDRIRSRFEWGLIADISSPDYETRMAILRKKEELDGYHIDDAVVEYIATNIKSNIRELEGSLNKIMAFANLEKKEVTLALAEKVLRDMISPNEKRVLSLEYIMATVAEHFDMALDDLKGNKRNKKIVFPRQIAMYLCREMLNGVSLVNIARSFGKNDHTTVIHACKQIEKEMDLSEDTQDLISVLKKKINPPV